MESYFPNGWMSGLVMFADGWCFTWNVVGCWSLFTCCVSRGTWVMLVKEIFCACGRVLKLVLWGGCGVFAQMNVGLAGFCHLVLCFLVFQCFSMFHVKHDIFTTTHLFHVKRRVGWLSCWWWFLRTLSLVVVEEVVFHVKHWFWILFSCWEMRFSVSRHWHAWLLFRSKEK